MCLGTSNTAKGLAIVHSPKHPFLSRWTTNILLTHLPCTKKKKKKNPLPCIMFSDITGEIVKTPIRTQNYRIPSGKYTWESKGIFLFSFFFFGRNSYLRETPPSIFYFEVIRSQSLNNLDAKGWWRHFRPACQFKTLFCLKATAAHLHTTPTLSFLSLPCETIHSY